MQSRTQYVIALLAFLVAEPTSGADSERHFSARQVFDYSKAVLFYSDFAKSGFEKLNLSIDATYRLSSPDAARLAIVETPGMPDQKAIRFTVPRARNSFRSEVALPSERGFQERYYQISLLVPEDWQIDNSPGADIVIQWHAVPGDWRPTHPNLAIAIDAEHWVIRQSFGDPKTKPTRTRKQLRRPVQRGDWIVWTIHARWSPDRHGLVRVWRDGVEAYSRAGPNAYGTIGTEYTPYLKCGIYHPDWNTKGDDRRQRAFIAETNPVSKKEVFVMQVIIASKDADLEHLLFGRPVK